MDGTYRRPAANRTDARLDAPCMSRYTACMQEVREQVVLAPLMTFGIGGPASFFVDVRSEHDIKEAIQWANQRGMKFVVLAGCSNVLVPDEGLSALVIHFIG